MQELVSWKIGGEQGQGIDLTGDILAKVYNRLGYFVYAYKEFSSRIKGGHSNYMVRISKQPIAAASANLNILIALDQETIDKNASELVEGGLVIADKACTPTLPTNVSASLLIVPLQEMAHQVGHPLVRNVIALGVTAHVLGLPLAAMQEVIKETFASKGDVVLAQNEAACRRGYAYALEHILDKRWQLVAGDGCARLVMTGNEAAALAALAAGCRFISAYPITPASEIFELLAKQMPEYHGVALQCEDEIAAVMAAIGAGYAGARAMTATSGPGLALMQEALGLGQMAEVPLVVIDVQRGGPSTGMPTRHEQSDVLAALYGTSGDTPRIVLTPGTVEDVFYDTAAAFNLADRYQCPVYVLLDLALSFNKQTVTNLSLENIRLDRGLLAATHDLQVGQRFPRYAITDSGISPRSLPGQPGGQYVATGLEHDKYGRVCEEEDNRVRMMDKRFRKLTSLQRPGLIYNGAPNPEILLVGFGSSWGALAKANEQLTATQWRCGHAHVRMLAPFPAAEIAQLMQTARIIIVAENNAGGQLAQIMKLQVGEYLRRQGNGEDCLQRIHSLLRYDGHSFLPENIITRVEEVSVRAYAR